MDHVEFNPPQQTLQWQESVHTVKFRLRAADGLEGKTARGSLSVYLGVLLLADVPLQFLVSRSPPSDPSKTEQHKERFKRYRNIFASYSHEDLAIVEQCEQYAAMSGDQYYRDWKNLRAGRSGTMS